MLGRSILCVVGGGALVLGLVATPASAAADPGRGRCISELAQAGLIGRDFNPGKANIIVGSDGDDVFQESMFTDGVDVVCGFGGNDTIGTLNEGDVFVGGAGDDTVQFMNGGTFYGGTGDDRVDFITSEGATFFGGEGNDRALFNFGGTFHGGAGDDEVLSNEGTVNGGPGNDLVQSNEEAGTFNGEAGDDTVFYNAGTFNGGPGIDTVEQNDGVFNQ